MSRLSGSKHLAVRFRINSIKSSLEPMDDVEGVDDDLEIGQIQNARSFNKFQDLIVALASAALSAALVTRGGLLPMSLMGR